MTSPPEPGRRSILRGGIGLAASVASVSGTAMAQGSLSRAGVPVPVQLTSTTAMGLSIPSLSNASMMVAGLPDAASGRWARLLARPLAAALHPGSPLAVSAVGGRDGVTGANAFEALINPDGSSALLVPGMAAVAWLAGDPRVHFDAGRWVPALTSFASAVLLGRIGTQPTTLRVAVSTPTGVELAALLGLSLLGRAPVPVFGLSDPNDAHAAFLDGHVDAILLTGSGVPARTAAWSGHKLQPIFSLGADALATARDPALANVPTLPELYRTAFGRPPSGTLFEAWKATAAAARLDVALVLQPLTPASLVAQWRRACTRAITDPTLVSAARAAQVNSLPAPDCVTALSAIVADENTLLVLRRWIAGHTNWRPA